MNKRLLIVIGLAAIVQASLSSTASAQAGTSAVAEGTPRTRLVLLPIVFSSPDTRLALGVLPQLLFQTGPETRLSNLRADIYYTFNRQFNVVLKPAVWLPGDRWQLNGSLRLQKWPTTFYGIGPGTSDDEKEKFTEYLATGTAEVLHRVRPSLYLGGSYVMRWGRVRDPIPDDGALGSRSVPGTGDTRVAGLYAVMTWDTRDHVYLPESGALYRLSVGHFAPAFGSDRSFTRASLDLRQYVAVRGPVMTSFRATLDVQSRNVPFRMLPGIGEVIRGYATTRYIDRFRWSIQAELRAIPVWWRFGFSVFGGIGSVAGSIGDFTDARIEAAAGIGIRFLLSPASRMTVRQDFAFGRGSSGDYLDVDEAF